MNKQRKTSHILNVFQYDHATGIIGLNGAPVSGYGLYLTTNINDGSVGIDSSASINALYLLKNTTKQFEISYDTSGATKIFRLLPYQSGSFFQIGNPSNAANSNSDYVFISESTYGNVLIGPGIGNGTGNLTGATASIHKVQFNGAVFANNSIQATSFKITGGASTGFLKADGTVDAVTYLSGNQSITVSGDATGSGTTSIALTLANTAVTPGVYGSTTLVPVVTVDSKGRITSVTTAAISGSLTFTGDVTGSGTTGTSTAMTLAASGVTAGTYTKVTVDSKGRVTVGASATTSDISEGTNLYYTDARVLSYLSANTYATQSYVNTQVSNLVAAAPATLDTLNELAAALGNDPSFATTISTALGNRLRVDINNQGLSATLQGYGRTNLGLGTAATSNTGDFVAYRTFGTAANSAIGDFVAYRTFGTAANNNTGDFALASHTHSIADVTGLQTALDGKQASGSYAASSHSHIISDVTGLQTALDGKQASLGFTPYNSTNPSGYISSYTETDTLATVTARGSTTTIAIGSPNFYDTTGSYNVNLGSGGSEGRGLVAGYSGGSYGGIGYNVRHTTTGGSWLAPGTDTSSYVLFTAGGFVFFGAPSGAAGRSLSYITLGSFSNTGLFNAVNITSGGNQVWHVGNLTNLNQLTNGPGYITSYTEVDTLATVTGRGNTTTSSMAIGSGSIPNGKLYVNSGSGSDVVALQNTLNTGAYLVFADNVTPTWANAPRLGAISNDMVFKTLDTERFRIASTGASTFTGPSLTINTTGDIVANGDTFRMKGGGGSAEFIWYRNYSGSPSEPGFVINNRAGATTFSHNANGGGTSVSGNFSAANFSGSSSGTNTGDQTNISGNAATATTATYASYLNALTNYSWTSSSLPNTYHQGITSAFVGPNAGEGSWQNYGSVMTMRTYSGGGGSLQLYTPYGPSNGGDSLQVRFGNYNVSTGNSWTGWKTLIDSGNIGSQTVATAGNASTLGGYGPNQTGGAYNIVQRDANGYIQNSYFYMSGGGSERNSSGLGYVAGFNSSDYYVRSYNSTAVASFLGLGSMAYASTGSYLPLSGGTLSNTLNIGSGGSTNAGLLNITGATHNQVNITHGSGWGMLLGYCNEASVSGYHGPYAAAIINVQDGPLHLGTGNSSRALISQYGQLLINAASSGYGPNSYGYNLGMRGNASQAYISVALSGQTLDTQGLIIGIDTTAARFHVRDSKTISFANADVERMTLDTSANLVVNGSVRAPIFYDTNDTAYYLNPAGGSRLRNLYVGDSGDDWSDPGGWGTQIRFSNGPHVKFVLHARTPGIEAGMYVHTPSSVYIGSYTSHDVSMMYAGSRKMQITNSYIYTDVYLEAAGSLRAPIFYDSNNTSYYGDFASISSMYGVAIRGDLSSVDSSNQIFFWGSGNSTTSAIGFKANGGSFGNPTGFGDGYNTYLTMDTDGRGWVFRRGVGGTDFSSAYTAGWILNNGIWQANAQMRAPQFRFTNSTNNAYLTGNSEWGFRAVNDNGYIQFGPANGSWSHIYSDKSFYFNQELYVNNQIVIHSGSIGSQTVATAGNSNTVGGVGIGNIVRKDTTGQYLRAYYQYGSYLTSETPQTLVNEGIQGGGLRVDFMHPSYTGSGGWNHVITWSGYNGYNMYQLGGHYDGSTGTNLWVRSEANHGLTSWTAWRRLLNTSSDPYAANMNQYVRTSDGPTFTNVYNNGWFRNNNVNEGVYNQATGTHFYSGSGTSWTVTGSGGTVELLFRSNHQSTLRGYVYGDTSSNFGLLDNSGNWQVRLNPNNNGGQLYGNWLFSGAIRRSSHSTGFLEGSYNNVGGNSAYTNPIYTIGSSYNPSDSSLGSMYGIGYSHPNFWGGGKTSSWGMYVCAGGTINATIGSGAVTIWAENDIVAFSDARVKDNIEVVENAIEKIQAIRGVTFTRKDAKIEDQNKRHAGVIAQEVLKVMPEVVSGTEKDMYSVAYGNMAALFIEAIKEQQKQIEELKNKLDNVISSR